MVNLAAARDALHRRMAAVFEAKTFSAMHPEAKVPKVVLGFPRNETPFYVAVDEIADAVGSEGGATMGHAEVEFELHVWLFANHADLKTAADTLMAYVETVMAAVLADPQLDMTVDSAFPSVDSAGTAADSSKRHIAAASVRIACTRYSACPAEIREAVHESNRNA